MAFASGYLDEASPEQIAMLEATSITVPPGSLQSDDGTTGEGRSPLPVSAYLNSTESLAMPLVITVQTDGQLILMYRSLQDSLMWIISLPVLNPPFGVSTTTQSLKYRPMTVSEDGKYLESDPGVGIRQPGWHGFSELKFSATVITGPSVKPKSNACGVSHANMDLTENEYTSVDAFRGHRETIFGANDDEISFPQKSC